MASRFFMRPCVNQPFFRVLLLCCPQVSSSSSFLARDRVCPVLRHPFSMMTPHSWEKQFACLCLLTTISFSHTQDQGRSCPEARRLGNCRSCSGAAPGTDLFRPTTRAVLPIGPGARRRPATTAATDPDRQEPSRRELGRPTGSGVPSEAARGKPSCSPGAPAVPGARAGRRW